MNVTLDGGSEEKLMLNKRDTLSPSFGRDLGLTRKDYLFAEI